MNWGLIIAIILLIIGGVIITKWLRQSEEEEVVLDNQDMLQTIADYRTYIINQWVCLLAFWFGIDVKDAQTKMVCPGYNQNAIYFYYENLEIYAFFNWEEDVMIVKTNVYKEDDGYLTHVKKFSLRNKDLKTKDLFKFIQKAKNEHYGIYELSAADVVSITKQLKIQAKGFPSDDAAKTHLFNQVADLILLMRQKKLRNNRHLFKIYMGFIYWFWNTYSAEFLQYLSVTEEEFMGNDTNNETNEGNE